MPASHTWRCWARLCGRDCHCIYHAVVNHSNLPRGWWTKYFWSTNIMDFGNMCTQNVMIWYITQVLAVGTVMFSRSSRESGDPVGHHGRIASLEQHPQTWPGVADSLLLLIASSSSWLRILPRGSEFFLVAHISSSLLNRNFPHHCVKFFLTVRTLPHKQNYSSQIELFLTVRTLPHKQNSSSQAEFI